MAKSFIGKGWANQARLRKQKRWAELTPQQQQKRRAKANARKIQAQKNFHDLLPK